MIDKLDASLRFHQQALSLRHQRHEVLANNIANADTPNYKARDFDFSTALSRATQQAQAERSGPALATTSSRHIPGGMAGNRSAQELFYRVPGQPSLDGNTVDMERERVQFTDNAVRYQASLTLLTSRIQGLKSAMQSE